MFFLVNVGNFAKRKVIILQLSGDMWLVQNLEWMCFCQYSLLYHTFWIKMTGATKDVPNPVSISMYNQELTALFVESQLPTLEG